MHRSVHPVICAAQASVQPPSELQCNTHTHVNSLCMHAASNEFAHAQAQAPPLTCTALLLLRCAVQPPKQRCMHNTHNTKDKGRCGIGIAPSHARCQRLSAMDPPPSAVGNECESALWCDRDEADKSISERCGNKRLRGERAQG